jgi:hypothetical protein
MVRKHILYDLNNYKFIEENNIAYFDKCLCTLKQCDFCQVLVAHTCNPSYSGGRVQEDLSSKPTQANSSRDLI